MDVKDDKGNVANWKFEGYPPSVLSRTGWKRDIAMKVAEFRLIPLNAKHSEHMIPTYLGDSVAHWEGDTLVVDRIGFNDKTWLMSTGTFHSDQLHITERSTKPWTVHSTMMLREGARVQEYICAENNLDPARCENLLKNGINFQR